MVKKERRKLLNQTVLQLYMPISPGNKYALLQSNHEQNMLLSKLFLFGLYPTKGKKHTIYYSNRNNQL